MRPATSRDGPGVRQLFSIRHENQALWPGVGTLSRSSRGGQAAGFRVGLEREGVDGLMIPIGRHNDLDNQMAEIIYKEAAAKPGKRWWK